MVDKPVFCAQAFGSVCINSSGEYIPCCNIRINEWQKDYSDKTKYPTVIENANNAGLRKLRKELSEGIYPDVCKNCIQAEDNGVESMRTIWNKALADCDIPMHEVLLPENVYYLDTTFSTKCNSKCMTCTPSSSDFWEKEHNFIWQANYRVDNRINVNESMTNELLENFPNVVKISFVGGEPTISDEHFTYLERLVESDRSKNIKLNYVTNLTGVTAELLDIWKNFQEVHLNVSIDAYGKVNEYIRYPFKWSKVDSTLREILSLVQHSVNNPGGTQFSAGLSATVSLFNAIQCFDLFDYYFDLLSQYSIHNEKTLASYCSIFVNYVTFPSFAMVNNLSTKYRHIGIIKGEALLDKLSKYSTEHPNEQLNQGMIESIKLAIEWLKEPYSNNHSHLVESKLFITRSDLFRNRHIKDYIPELFEELETLWNTLP